MFTFVKNLYIMYILYSQGVQFMFKKIGIVLICVAMAATVFAGCSKKNTDNETPSGGLEDSAQEFGFEEDEDGNTVAVEYDGDKAYVIDDNGNRTGEVIKHPKNRGEKAPKNETTAASDDNGRTPNKQEDRPNVPNKTDGEETKKELTTLPFDDIKVPSTSASGKKVKFSNADVATVTHMLEVPYLYMASYENTDQVPISIATHVACWMLERENLNTSSFASGTVVIDLFNYFDRTVVSFKTECNSYTGNGATNAAPITYNSDNDTFKITSDYEAATHEVTITEIQNLGNNNYYKVIGTVKASNGSNCKATKVEAVIQKNKLDSSLGFSVKALKWS